MIKYISNDEFLNQSDAIDLLLTERVLNRFRSIDNTINIHDSCIEDKPTALKELNSAKFYMSKLPDDIYYELLKKYNQYKQKIEDYYNELNWS